MHDMNKRNAYERNLFFNREERHTRTSDVDLLAADADDVLASKQLLGDDGSESTEQVTLAVNNDALY